MFSVFQKYITEKKELSTAEWELIESVSHIKKLRKHQYLLQEGEVWNYHAFVCEGCLRRYHVDEKGVEHSVQFSIENWWAGDRESLINETASKYNINAVENSIVLLISKEDFEKVCKTIPSFTTIISSILQKSLNTSQKRIHADISFSAEEKYLLFTESFPKLVNRIPRHMLASYLGMTPETLSRVRKMTSKK